jgi:cbb3-type cytochrome oxidase subunit 3
MNSADLVQTTLATAAIALFPAAIVFWVFRKAKR